MRLMIRAWQEKLVVAAGAAVLLGLALRPVPAAAIQMSPALQKMVDGAKKEGSLNLEYGGGILGSAQGARVAVAGIKKMFGVDLKVTYTPGPSFAPMAAKVYTEMKARQPASTDVYYGTAVQITPYLKRGLFRKIPWTALYPGRITPQIVEGGDRALRITTGLPGVLYNKRTDPEFGKVVNMSDLLEPQFKGKIYTQPYLAGFDVLVAGDMWGYDKSAAFVRKFSAQIGGLLRCGEPDRIASGEVPALAIDCTGSEENLPRFRNVLSLSILHDAAMRRYDYICVPTNAAHPDAAILFGLYASSPEGQEQVLLDLFGNGLDSYPDSPTHAKIAALEKQGVKFRDVTITWWSAQKNIESNLKKLIKIITER
jgi:ABC-type Fe3+ transport system substrate-binding protein